MCRWKYTSGKSVFSISIPATILFILVLYPPPPPTPLDTMKQKQKQKQKGVVSIEKRKTLICLFVCFIQAIRLIDSSIDLDFVVVVVVIAVFFISIFFCLVKLFFMTILNEFNSNYDDDDIEGLGLDFKIFITCNVYIHWLAFSWGIYVKFIHSRTDSDDDLCFVFLDLELNKNWIFFKYTTWP